MRSIILAAGESKRMKSKTAKHVHELAGRPLLAYIIQAQAEASGACEASGQPPVVVVGHNREQISERIKQNVLYAVQEQQLGTGHAVLAASEYIATDEDVVVQMGDTPLIKPETIRRLAAYHAECGSVGTAASVRVDDPKGCSRVIRDSAGAFLCITEQTDLSPVHEHVNEISVGLFIFKGGPLLEALRLLKNDNAQGEYYLTEVFDILRKQGHEIGALAFADPEEFIGVNDRAQLAQAEAAMRQRINLEHMRRGVTMIDPAAAYIDYGVRIGEETVICPNTIIKAGTIIERECVIGPNSSISNSTIGARAEVANSEVVDSKVGADTSVGPFAYIRPGSIIGEHCKVGDFVEVKNSTLGDNTKASHLTYIGDADVGGNVNFGCGTVTVNYDGKHKHRTTIGDDVFIGCNTNLVAPVTVHTGAYIAAGSTIDKEVPGEGLAIARARQVHKPEWRRKG
jgi:bifunctional UDP-N-acetylglucosamine pyrophosphorylase/glucosamine-1-phosphate N-acetyltransferase